MNRVVTALASGSRRRREQPTARSADPPAVAAILDSAEFAAAAQVLADKLEVPQAQVVREAAGHLREMAATHNETVIGWWTRFGHWMLRGFELLVDEEGLASVRALDGQHSLVFLIAHRSYLDEWVVPPALAEFGINPPFGVAGANLNFFPLGTVARRTGIVHVRRATSDAPIYKFALRTFIGHMVTHHENLIWSIEGGRSRTGKLRPPRLGLLRYVVDAVEHAQAADVLLVPVSVIYDQLPHSEVELITSEARGQSKTPEDARWFLGYLRGLRHRVGRIYVDIGEPMPLRSRLEELKAADPSGLNSVERVALEVSHRINVATPVTPTAAVCVALLAADRALTLEEIRAAVQPMAEYVEARHWPTAGAANLRDGATLRRAAQDLVESGVLTSFWGGDTTVWVIGPQQHLIAAMYRNSLIHVVLLRALVEIVFVSARDSHEDTTYDPWAEALRLRDLLKFDFFFAGREQFAKDLQAELRLIDTGTTPVHVDPSPTEAARYLAAMQPLLSHLVLRPYLDAYSVVAAQLVAWGDTRDFDEQRFIDQCLLTGHQWVLQRRIASEESTSTEMFRTVLRLARHRGLVESDDADVAARRRAFADEVGTVQRRIALIAAEAAEHEAAAGLATSG